MTYLLFAVALSLSAIAAYYAIMGLIAIFAAAVVPIAIMGTLLEASKLTVASWLYQNWKEIPKLLKSYFTIALFVLMMLTSMGIFGFLSKAHLDQAVPSGDVAAKLALIDEKIKTEKENINASRKELSQLDAQVDQTIARTTEASGTDRAIAIRRGQAKDRSRILNEIQAAQAKIAKLNEERAPIASEVRKVEAEVGPIKYIAALIYGDNLDDGLLEKAVRIVIIMIVLVFDPLAVLLLVAANWNLKNGIESHWSSLFVKHRHKPVVQDKQEEEIEPIVYVNEKPIDKEISIKDEVKAEDTTNISKEADIPVLENEEMWANRVIDENQKEVELPEIKVEEGKDWEPPLFNRLPKTIEYDSAGRRITPETEDEYIERSTPSKTRSFLSKVNEIFTFSNPKPGTIEKEVDDLQKDKKNS